jgi:hypothetical protein
MRVRPYDIGCEPSPSVPAETLLQDGWCTYLLFAAVSKEIGEDGYPKDLGVAVLRCRGCQFSKFGYPNDEGLPEHPLYAIGMSGARTSIFEVIDSAWGREVSEQMAVSARRIWGQREIECGRTSTVTKHFIVTLKELTFECIALSLAVERFCNTFEEAFAYVIEKFKDH